jgi:hypothetical protein
LAGIPQGEFSGGIVVINRINANLPSIMLLVTDSITLFNNKLNCKAALKEFEWFFAELAQR